VNYTSLNENDFKITTKKDSIMKRREFLQTTTTGLLATMLPVSLVCKKSSKSQKDQSTKLNVIFIAGDDLRSNLACFGDPLAITPQIDSLAKQGMIFNRHFVQAPSCAPSRTSMLTGLRPDEVKVTNHKTHFRDARPEAVTMPQLFKNKGYSTINLGKIFHHKAGYNDSVSWTEEHLLKERNYVLPENVKVRGKAASSECIEVDDVAYIDGRIADKAIDYLKKFKESNSPFFLGIGHLKPHMPFNAPKKYWDLYNREDFRNIKNRERPLNAPEIAFHQWQELRGYKDIPGKGPLSAEKEMELRHGYYACVSFIDAQIGKVLKMLDELNLRENTIIVLWGDHGYHLGEQDLWCKSTNFDLAARSPLIISAPGIGSSGQNCGAIVESVDLYPTIIDLCGIEPSDNLSGTSLKPLLEDPNCKWKNIAFNQFVRPYPAAIGARVPASHMGYSVRTEEWRYTAWYNLIKDSFEFPELYSFSQSSFPDENLAGKPEFAETVTNLHKLVQEYKDGKYNKGR
jgi:iduronate 2-sulfatase